MISDQLELWLRALEPIARVTGGYATVVDKNGHRLKTVDSQGQEVKELRGTFYPKAYEVLQKGLPEVGASQLQAGAQAWYLPLGEFVLAASNIERIQEEELLRDEFTKALPMIASVAGGDAFLFDEEGIRRAGYRPSGQVAPGLDEYSEQCHAAIVERKPLIGPSCIVEGAMAVRIPVGKRFGLSFNNEWSVKQKHKLLEKVRSSQYARYTFEDIVGESEAIYLCKKQATKVALTNSTVLLRGESGTGKELFAQSIHNASSRRDRPFIAINCGAIPLTLAESYLFGYEGGAFTGAKKEGQKGVFEQANGGTIFLDEVSEMKLDLQAELLRVVQEREVWRVGGKKSIPVDVRIIASSNKDLKALVEEGQFREDLYYRLNVVEILIPPMRERAADILPLARCFLQRFNPLMGAKVVDFTEEATEYLLSYDWPGNVRELQNCIERALNHAEGRYITPVDLPAVVCKHDLDPPEGKNNLQSGTFELRTKRAIKEIESGKEVQKTGEQENRERIEGSKTIDGSGFALNEMVKTVEKETLQNILREVGNSRKETARRLGISTTTLWRKMKQYGL